MKTFRLKVIEKLLNWILEPHERVIAAQKILAQHGKDPKVQENFEKAFGVTQATRTQKQWTNLVRVYGIETVAKIENMSENAVRLKLMKFSDRIKEEFKRK